VYSRRFLAETAADRARFEAEGRRGVVRLKMPREGTLVIDDLVRGKVEVQWAREQDHVIQRADGSCLYHLANVVDDHDFQITHVIRAEEHLSNTPRQVFMIQALGYPLPQYAHLPFVAEPGSRNKLSKRKLDKYLKNRDFAVMVQHGQKIAARIGLDMAPETFNPVIVDFYRQVGYLPQAIINYLALLGWSLDDKTEFFSRRELIDCFSLERVNKAPASFDSKKLWSFQEHYMQLLPVEEKVSMMLPYLQRAGLIDPGTAGPDVEKQVALVVRAAGERIKTAGDILDYDFFFLPDDRLTCDQQAFEKSLHKPGAAELLRKFRARLAAAESFEAAALERLMQEFVAAEGIETSQIIHSVRVAVTGKAIGLGLFDSLAILGRERTLGRIDLALDRLKL
jgi:glutamyl-tRNA synthetase